MDEIIFQITTENIGLVTFFSKYEKLLNEFYTKTNQPGVIEVIQNGFVYIVKDFQNFSQMALDSPRIIKEISHPHPEIIKTLENALRETYKIQNKAEIMFSVSSNQLESDLIIPLWQKSFQPFVEGIRFEKVDNRTFSMIFPNIEAVIRYFALFYNIF